MTISPLPQSPESFPIILFSFLTLLPEWGACMELSVPVGSPPFPIHASPPNVLKGVVLILTVGMKWRESLRRGRTLISI